MASPAGGLEIHLDKLFIPFFAYIKSLVYTVFRYVYPVA
jgi:hypothetical protein